MTRLRVATYNVYLGADLELLLGPTESTDPGPGASPDGQRAAYLVQEVVRQLQTTAFPRRVEALAKVVAEVCPDILALQEMTAWQVDGEPLWHFEPLLLEALAALGTPYDVVVDVPTFEGSGSAEVDGRVVELRLVGSNTTLRRRDSEVEVEQRGSGLFGHALGLSSVVGEVSIARGWCAVAARVPGAHEVIVVNTHTEAYEAVARNRQRDELLSVVSRWADHPLVVVGDFNAGPDRVGLSDVFVDAWETAADEPARDGVAPGGADGATCGQDADLSNPEGLLSQRIDYVWVRGMPVHGCRRFGHLPRHRTPDGLWPSDHAGVVADVGAPPLQERPGS